MVSIIWPAESPPGGPGPGSGRRGGAGGWGWLPGGGGGRHPGVRVSEGVRGGRAGGGGGAAAARPGEGGFSRPLSLSFSPRCPSRGVPAPRRRSSRHGTDSPCPPQCPAGWGKMPKWRPATTLDSPTAGRRRRRLRPSIGNGSPRRPPVPILAPRSPRAAPRPGGRAPAASQPGGGGERPSRGRELGAAGLWGLGGPPATKMASRGLRARSPPPPCPGGWEVQTRVSGRLAPLPLGAGG